MSSLSSKVAFLALLSASVASAQDPNECGPSRSGDYEFEVLSDGPTIRWTMDADAGTIDFQMETAAEAWTGLAFSADFMMAGSDAVVGMPDDQAVMEFDLAAYDEITPYNESDITNGVVSQENGQTTLSFTRTLTPVAEGKQVISSTPGDLTVILWAFGPDNSFGYHGPDANRFGVWVDLFCGEGAASNGTVAETPAPSVTGDMMTTTPTEAGTMMPLAEGSTLAPAVTPAPAAIGGGGGGGGGGGVMDMTPAPTAGSRAVTMGPSSAPTGAEDGDGQGDPSGAARVGGTSWAAVAAAGAVTVLAALSL